MLSLKPKALRTKLNSYDSKNETTKTPPFASKQAACRELGITMKRLERIIDKCLQIEYEGAEYFLDELLPITGEEE